MKTIVAADLFAGAGGTSTALRQACESRGLRLKLTAVNHWPTAVETHAANHPDAAHLCETLDSVDPRKAVPGGRLDVLCASPECTHHSNARGGKPCDDQSRATAWHVVRWAEALRPKVILIENVREMLTWGPLGTNGRPLQRRKGETFAAWLNALRSVGYTVGTRLVNAADYGGATTRTRLFVLAVRGRGPVPWAAPTHEREPAAGGLFGALPRWRAAREVIDWTIPGRSIFDRPRPLKPNTVRRIMEGVRRFWGLDPEPFLVRLRGTAGNQMATSARAAGEPVPTLSAGGEHVGLCSPFVLGQQSGAVARGVGDPLPTVAGAGAISVVQPFVLPPEGVYRGNAARGVEDAPLQTITAGRGGGHLVQPFLVPTNYGERPGQSPRVHDLAAPVPTVVGADTHGVCSPFVVKYTRTGGAYPLTDPLDTVTARDRFGLVTGSGAYVADILFRMLEPHELAAAMGFPAGYVFKGTRGDRVKMVGNAVEVNKARAHLLELSYLLAA